MQRGFKLPNRLYNMVVVLAVVASATIASWHGVIQGATYTAIVTAALGIGGVVHANGGSKPPPNPPS